MSVWWFFRFWKRNIDKRKKIPWDKITQITLTGHLNTKIVENNHFTLIICVFLLLFVLVFFRKSKGYKGNIRVKAVFLDFGGEISTRENKVPGIKSPK